MDHWPLAMHNTWAPAPGQDLRPGATSPHPGLSDTFQFPYFATKPNGIDSGLPEASQHFSGLPYTGSPQSWEIQPWRFEILIIIQDVWAKARCRNFLTLVQTLAEILLQIVCWTRPERLPAAAACFKQNYLVGAGCHNLYFSYSMTLFTCFSSCSYNIELDGKPWKFLFRSLGVFFGV